MPTYRRSWIISDWKLRPFSADWELKIRVIAVRQFLEMLFTAIGWAEPSAAFIKRALKQSRYSQPAVRTIAERMAVPEASECYSASKITGGRCPSLLLLLLPAAVAVGLTGASRRGRRR